MRLGLGALRLPPSEFWRMSISELVTAIDGLAMVNGSDPDSDGGMTWDDVLEIESRCRREGLIH